MKSLKTKVRSLKPGFTLIESLVVLAVFVLITTAFYSAFAAGIRQSIDSKNRLGAAALANEKMEIVRNLDYDKIGTITGMVHGDLLNREAVNKNTRNYYVFTNVNYVDDPLDGTLSSDITGMGDYKKVRIKVSWEDDINAPGNKSVVLVSTFSPNGIEANLGGGTLSINVLDNSTTPLTIVSQASVRIINPSISVDETVLTDSTGNIIYPSAPAGTESYMLEISKNGYYPVKTYPAYPASSFKPDSIHISVREGEPTTINMYTGKISSFKIKTQDSFGTIVPNVDFSIQGGKRIGEDAADSSKIIFDFSGNSRSDGNGEVTFSERSFGFYTFTPVDPADYEFVKIYPNAAEALDKVNSFKLPADANLELRAIFASKTTDSLLVTVLNGSNGEPVKNATVKLTDMTVPPVYEKTLTVDSYGQVFFPEALPALTVGQYNLEITAEGFQTKNENNFSINQYTKKIITITPN